MRNMEQGEEQLEFFSGYGAFKGRAPRSVLHNNGEWHKGAHVWVFNSSGGIFLKKRAQEKEFYPEHWEDMGEHLKPGESFEQAALRGLREELGITGAKVEKVAEAKNCFPEKNCEFSELWKCTYDGKISENIEESFGGRFFSIKEIRGMLKEREAFTPWFKEMFYRYMKEGLWEKKT
ncbi:MAG: NUDIX domain-containing protein [Candidatus Diapherotrites archaeon]|nr:NUDIX domain-containing protein [Candidatus Diapherotrites archaeon]